MAVVAVAVENKAVEHLSLRWREDLARRLIDEVQEPDYVVA